jgi:hypothetical protein
VWSGDLRVRGSSMNVRLPAGSFSLKTGDTLDVLQPVRPWYRQPIAPHDDSSPSNCREERRVAGVKGGA